MGRCKSNLVVAEYSLDGNLLNIYPNALIASKEKKAFRRTIDKCIRGEMNTAYGSMWRRYSKENIPSHIDPFVCQKIKSTKRVVKEVDEKGNIIKIYSSIKEASRELHIDPHSIRDVLSGKISQTKGHIFIE